MIQLQLFKNDTKLGEDDYSTLFEYLGGWAYVLPINALKQFLEIKHRLDVIQENGHIVYPKGVNMTTIFRKIGFSNIKVVIVGENPYPNSNANGIAFSCETNISKSLNIIFDSIEYNTKSIKDREELKNLNYLTSQGVFFLNSCLSIGSGHNNFHEYIGWQHFVASVLHTISYNKGISFLFWGKKASIYENCILKRKKHLILNTNNPTKSENKNREWKCNHFKKVNSHLKKQGKQQINWYKYYGT